MVTQGRQVGGDGIEHNKDAKHLLDSIGEKVYKEKVEKEAKTYKGELEGNLTSATSSHSETASTLDPCEFDYTKELIGAKDGKRHPCKNLKGITNEKRFSDKIGGQCTKEKISGSTSTCGACAPYRRLHLCSHNLETISDYDSTKAKHKLLAEVCYAAIHEGESLRGQHGEHKGTNNESQLCTVLARSFADIGDIVRGKDLFLGNDEEKKQRKKLDDNLKTIFEKIHSEVTNGSNGEAAKERYKDDGGNFFQLREDWWTANRHTVWKAITCGHPGGKYFRNTCAGGTSLTQDNCRCDGKNAHQVPTYFDYVPQFLRWFEEWAEDFCRKRKHKLENAKEQCRGEGGNDKYCSGNGYDCKKTVRAKRELVEGDCHDCLVACSPFVKWLDNQKLEFEKQKKKYKSEIKKYTNGAKEASGTSKRRKRSASNNYGGYEKHFYEQLKGNFDDVDKFLNILNKEGICKEQPNVKGETADSIDFKNENTGKTFSRTKICEPCPWCGVKDGDPPWTPKEEKECRKDKKETYKQQNITEIPVLYPEEQSDILKKYKKLCANGKKDDQIKKWECYYDDSNTNSGQNNNCIQGTWDTFTQDKKVMSYNAFFWDWVYHMLHDSLEWRNELGSCIDKDKSEQCENKCNSKCECFLKWVQQKEKEWKQIIEHFYKQKDISQVGFLGKGMTPDFVLEGVLKKDLLLKSIKDTHANANDIERIDKMLQETGAVAGVSGDGGGVAALGGTGAKGKHNTKIDKFLQDELNDANECLQKCKEQEQESRGRSLDGPDDSPPRDPTEDSEDSEEEEEEEDELPPEEASAEEPTAKETTEVTKQGEAPPATDPSVEVCNIVDKALKGDLNAACTLKYGKTAPTSWKCVTPSGDEKTAPPSNSGSICVPPRRRRLYVGKLHDWAKTVETQTSGSEAPSPSDNKLRDAFIQTAAIETFFLWHKYKAENTKTQSESPLQPLNGAIGSEQNPENQLLQGTIPEEFKRQMFYTLGDYRDILFSGSKDAKNGYNDILRGDKEIAQREEKIQEKLKTFFSNSGNQSSTGGKNPSQSRDTPSSWWELHGPHIWNGMICALTYKETGEKGQTSITQDPSLKTALWDDSGNKPKEDKYEYKTVELKEDEENGPKTAAASGDNTPLTDFISRPPYFRYLEEWGQNFCKERKKRLAQIKHECKVEANSGTGRKNGKKNPKCSCYGEHCDDQLDADPTNVSDLKCPGCGIECRKYRKWINTKKTEFDEQKSAYEQQKENYVNGSNGDGGNNDVNGFSTRLKTYKEAKEFLQKLGPCKKDNGGSDITFDDSSDTFEPATNCKPCSSFKINCQNGNCDNSKGNNCNGKKITAETFVNEGDSIGNVGMLVSDKNGGGFDGDLNEACREAHIFKGIKENKWKCRNVCGYVVCKPENGNGRENQNKIITIRGLVTHWVQNFLEDYNKIRKKLNPCMNSSDGSKCENKCDKKCKCVEQWIEKKRDEWKKIKERFNDQYKSENSGDTFPVKTILEEFKERPEFKNAIKPCKGLEHFQNSKECAVAATTQNGKKRDVVVCLIEKLEKEAEKCQEHQNIVENQTQRCQEYTPPDDDEPLEETEENPKNMRPGFCPPPEKPPEEETDDKCGEIEEKKDEKKEESEEPAKEDVGPTAGGSDETNPEQTPPLKPEPPAPEPPPPPPPLAPSDESILQTTIPFGVALALGSIAFLFLKVINIVVLINIKKKLLNIPSSKITDNEWNTLKDEFISNMLQNQPKDVPNDYSSGTIPTNTNNTTPSHDNVDNNTHPTPSRHTLDQKPFITSIHDRNLYTGEEYNYNVNMSTNSMDDTKYVSNNVYSGIDLINDSLSGEPINIYDELLKRKENELFGTNHVKQCNYIYILITK
ncbi:hypothetical protein PFNF135_02414 [Plasmodium falciparum NF135/5.C10]|uniref:Erythrocyte membrane protein 1 n=1 Tax=Plasmodium falciparum NF135/5.C10 TaxID=1036726 RepID=W4IIR1_PLAFA|nr:hypothetical protein PFNF135_02414 [Plasmodium falciparum NF135/5.C10]